MFCLGRFRFDQEWVFQGWWLLELEAQWEASHRRSQRPFRQACFQDRQSLVSRRSKSCKGEEDWYEGGEDWCDGSGESIYRYTRYGDQVQTLSIEINTFNFTCWYAGADEVRWRRTALWSDSMPCRVKIVFCEVKRMLLHVSGAPLLLVASFVLEYRTVALCICVSCVCCVFVLCTPEVWICVALQFWVNLTIIIYWFVSSCFAAQCNLVCTMLSWMFVCSFVIIHSCSLAPFELRCRIVVFRAEICSFLFSYVCCAPCACCGRLSCILQFLGVTFLACCPCGTMFSKWWGDCAKLAWTIESPCCFRVVHMRLVYTTSGGFERRSYSLKDHYGLSAPQFVSCMFLAFILNTLSFGSGENVQVCNCDDLRTLVVQLWRLLSCKTRHWHVWVACFLYPFWTRWILEVRTMCRFEIVMACKECCV